MEFCLLARADTVGQTSWEDRRWVRGWDEGSVVGRTGRLSYMQWVTCGSSLFLVAMDIIQRCLLFFFFF